jgi:hypothetical protein
MIASMSCSCPMAAFSSHHSIPYLESIKVRN